MAARLEIYKCAACGNIVEVLTGAVGTLECCGRPMEKLSAKTADAGKEKHVPVIEKVKDGLKVKVGSVAHPMEPKHYIEWIAVVIDGQVCRKFLKPGDAPEAVFCCAGGAVTAREHCNVHGLWEGK